jgi:hypothetical protein
MIFPCRVLFCLAIAVHYSYCQIFYEKEENIWNHRGRREILCVLQKSFIKEISERQRCLWTD